MLSKCCVRNTSHSSSNNNSNKAAHQVRERRPQLNTHANKHTDSRLHTSEDTRAELETDTLRSTIACLRKRSRL